MPAASESQARTNLRQVLHPLKRALPTECNLLVTDHFAVQRRQNAACTKSTRMLSRRRLPRPILRERDRAREIQSLTTAAQLYKDDLLPALYDDWLTPLRVDYPRRISEVLRGGNPVRRTSCLTGFAVRVAPSIANPAACSQSRPLERVAPGSAELEKSKTVEPFAAGARARSRLFWVRSYRAILFHLVPGSDLPAPPRQR